jgi:hypothetical protein
MIADPGIHQRYGGTDGEFFECRWTRRDRVQS